MSLKFEFYLTLTNVVIFGGEVSRLTVGVLHSDQLLLLWVLICSWQRHRCHKVGIEDVVSPEKHLGVVVEALDEPRIGQWRHGGVWSLDLAGFHPFVPLHHEGDERNLQKEILKVRGKKYKNK